VTVALEARTSIARKIVRLIRTSLEVKAKRYKTFITSKILASHPRGAAEENWDGARNEIEYAAALDSV
jgi:hypothetical protein